METTAFHDGLLKQHKLYLNIVFGMINIRSIKRKDEILSEVIKDENLCVLVVTETWLKSENDYDNLKKAICIRMDNKYDSHCVDRPSEHRG